MHKIRFAALSCISLILFPFLAYASNPLIFAEWLMEEIVAEGGNSYIADNGNSGNNNRLMLKSGAEPAISAGGYEGNCLVFEGNDCGTVQWAGFDSIKVELWFKAELTPSSPAQDLFSIHSGGSKHEIRIEGMSYTDLPGGNTRFKFYHALTGLQMYIPYPFNDSDWHYFLFEYDPVAGYTMRIDDTVKTKTVGEAGVFPQESGLFSLGCVEGNESWRPLIGSIDEVTITVPTEQVAYSCGDWGYYEADINMDCVVDFNDLAIMAQQWLQ
jgi:hypothetical protein